MQKYSVTLSQDAPSAVYPGKSLAMVPQKSKHSAVGDVGHIQNCRVSHSVWVEISNNQVPTTTPLEPGPSALARTLSETGPSSLTRTLSETGLSSMARTPSDLGPSMARTPLKQAL